jgi:hypothetical protein
MTLTQTQVAEIVNEAMQAAAVKAQEYYLENGDRSACGFAWVNIYEYNGTPIKGNTKLGKMLKAAGVRQDYTKAFQIWNPSRAYTQSVDILEAGADAAADVFKKYGFTAYAGSRLD